MKLNLFNVVVIDHAPGEAIVVDSAVVEVGIVAIAVREAAAGEVVFEKLLLMKKLKL